MVIFHSYGAVYQRVGETHWEKTHGNNEAESNGQLGQPPLTNGHVAGVHVSHSGVQVTITNGQNLFSKG